MTTCEACAQGVTVNSYDKHGDTFVLYASTMGIGRLEDRGHES